MDPGVEAPLAAAGWFAATAGVLWTAAREDRPAHLLRPCPLRLRLYGVKVEGPFKGSVPAPRPIRVAMLRLTVRIHVARHVPRILSARELCTCLLTVIHELCGVIR